MTTPSRLAGRPRPTVAPPVCRVCGDPDCSYMAALRCVEFRHPSTAPPWCQKSWQVHGAPSTSKERRREADCSGAERSAVEFRPTAAPAWCTKGARRTPAPSICRVTRAAADAGRDISASLATPVMSLPPVVAPSRCRAALLPTWATLLATPVAKYVRFACRDERAPYLRATVERPRADLPRCHLGTMCTATSRGCTNAGHTVTILPGWAMLLPMPEAWDELLNSANRIHSGAPRVC